MIKTQTFYSKVDNSILTYFKATLFQQNNHKTWINSILDGEMSTRSCCHDTITNYDASNLYNDLVAILGSWRQITLKVFMKQNFTELYFSINQNVRVRWVRWAFNFFRASMK